VAGAPGLRGAPGPREHRAATAGGGRPQVATAGARRPRAAPARTGVPAAPAGVPAVRPRVRPRAARGRREPVKPDRARRPGVAKAAGPGAPTGRAGTTRRQVRGAARPPVRAVGRAGRRAQPEPIARGQRLAAVRAQPLAAVRAGTLAPGPGAVPAPMLSPVARPEPRRAAAPGVPARRTAVSGPALLAVTAPRRGAGGAGTPTATTCAEAKVRSGARRAAVGRGPARADRRTGQAVVRQPVVRVARPGGRSGDARGRLRATAAGTGAHGPPVAGAATAPLAAAGASAARARDPRGKRGRGPAMRPDRGSPTRSARTNSTPKPAPSCTACRTTWPTAWPAT